MPASQSPLSRNAGTSSESKRPTHATVINTRIGRKKACGSASNPFRSKRRGGYALDEKVCSFRRTHLRSDFVKRLTFNSGSFHCISDGEDPKSKEIFWRPFNSHFLFIVRSRNSCISSPIRSTSSSNAKWPVSRRWSSALGISLFKSSAPSTVKIPSFLPHVISVGG